MSGASGISLVTGRVPPGWIFETLVTLVLGLVAIAAAFAVTRDARNAERSASRVVAYAIRPEPFTIIDQYRATSPASRRGDERQRVVTWSIIDQAELEAACPTIAAH